MKTSRIPFTLLLFALATSALVAQKSTELYIPIGESPGVSGTTTMIGEIEAVDTSSGTVTIRSDGETHIVRIDDKTHIYVDLSRAGERSYEGSLTDCRQGQMCEVKPRDDSSDRSLEAEWIKVRPQS